MNDYTDAIDAAQDGWSAPHPISIEALAADAGLFGSGVRLCGWSARETAGAAAALRLWDSNTVGQGNIAGNIGLAADLSESVWIGDKGVLCVGGLSVEVVAGEADLTVWLRHWQPA